MDSLAQMAGIPRTETIGGVQYTLSPISVWDYGEIEQHLLQSRRNPVEVVKQHITGSDIDPEIQKELLREAIQQETYQFLPEGVIGRYLMTRAGLVHLFWMMLRQEHPEVDSHAKAKQIVYAFVGNQLGALAEYIDRLNGFTQLKNSQPPDAPAADTKLVGANGSRN